MKLQKLFIFLSSRRNCKKVCNNIVKSIYTLIYEINYTFVNSENRKIFDKHRLTLNFADKINLKRSDKYIALSNLKHLPYIEKHKNIL